VIYNNNNNVVIHNNYRRLQDPILLFIIPMGTPKNFFEIYRQFGYMPLKMLVSPGLNTNRSLSWLACSV